MKRKGRKPVCSRSGCSDPADSYSSDCALCETHSKYCLCNFHANRRRVRLNKRNKLPRTEHKAGWDQQRMHSQGISLSDGESGDGFHFETPSSLGDRDHDIYLSTIRAQQKYTRVSRLSVCFPDFIFSTAASIGISDVRCAVCFHRTMRATSHQCKWCVGLWRQSSCTHMWSFAITAMESTDLSFRTANASTRLKLHNFYKEDFVR